MTVSYNITAGSLPYRTCRPLVNVCGADEQVRRSQCMQGPFPFAGRSAELVMLRSLPRGDYSVPLFIRDKQGLSQKQSVHVRVCSCLSGFTCAERSVAGAGLLPGLLAPLCAGFLALAGQWSVRRSWGYDSSAQAVSQG